MLSSKKLDALLMLTKEVWAYFGIPSSELPAGSVTEVDSWFQLGQALGLTLSTARRLFCFRLLPDMLPPLSSSEWDVSPDLKRNTGFILISPDYLPASPHSITVHALDTARGLGSGCKFGMLIARLPE